MFLSPRMQKRYFYGIRRIVVLSGYFSQNRQDNPRGSPNNCDTVDILTHINRDSKIATNEEVTVMEVMQAIQQRHSIRHYLDREVPQDVLAPILEAARLAPSGGNKQDWRFIVVRDAEQRRKLADASGQLFIGSAPLILVGVALNPNWTLSEIPINVADLAIAMTQVMLVATAHQLATCWIGSFNQAKVKQVLGIPEAYKVINLLPLGYPGEDPGARPRKPLSEIVAYDRF